MYKKGQASIELISILAVALLVLGILIATSRSAFEDMQTSLDSQLAERSLSELSSLAKLAYESGPGSLQRTTLHVPNTIVQNESYISSTLINMQVEHKYGVKDIPQPFEVPLRGDLTFEPGDYDVYAASHTGYVFITENPSLLTTETLIYLQPNAERTITIKNPGQKETIITALPDSGITLDWSSQKIDAGKDAQLKITAASSGTVRLTSTSGESETITVKVS